MLSLKWCLIGVIGVTECCSFWWWHVAECYLQPVVSSLSHLPIITKEQPPTWILSGVDPARFGPRSIQWTCLLRLGDCWVFVDRWSLTSSVIDETMRSGSSSCSPNASMRERAIGVYSCINGGLVDSFVLLVWCACLVFVVGLSICFICHADDSHELDRPLVTIREPRLGYPDRFSGTAGGDPWSSNNHGGRVP